MREKGAPVASIWAVMALVLLATAIVGLFSLGPKRALDVASAASLAVITDGLLQEIPAHALHRVELIAGPEVGSGGTGVAMVMYNGVAFPARIPWTGKGQERDPSDRRRSFRIELDQAGPFGPYRDLEVQILQGSSLVERPLAYWMAGRMGVAVPYDELVELSWNGRSMGIREIRERIGPDLEVNRHLGNAMVTICTHSAAEGSGGHWSNAANWEIHGDGITAEVANATLEGLLDLVADTLDLPDAGSDSLVRFIDVDAFLRYLAAYTVIQCSADGRFGDPGLVFTPRDGKFYPVLWDASLALPDSMPYRTFSDMLAQRMFSVPEWKAAYEEYISEALNDLHTQGAFYRHLEYLADRLRPAIAADRERTGQVSDDPGDMLHCSLLHWERAVKQLRTSRYERWLSLIGSAVSTEQVSTAAGSRAMTMEYEQ